MKRFSIATVLLFLFLNINGQIKFEKKFTPESNQFGKEIFELSDGGFLIQGTIEKGWRNAYLIRTNMLGDTLWKKTYGTDSIQYHIYDMVKMADGGYLMAGDYQSILTSPSMDSYIQKIDSQGNIIWSNLFGWTTSQGGYKDHAEFVKILKNNSIIVSGNTRDYYYSLNNFQHGIVGWNSYLAKFDNNTGNYLDVSMICDKIDTSCYKVNYFTYNFETINNKIYWFGFPTYFANPVPGNKTLAVFNNNFDTIFTLRTGLEKYNALSKTSDDHLLLFADSVIAKMDTLGNIVWTMPNSSPSIPYELKEISDGNFISIGGTSPAPIFDTDFSQINNEKVYINKYNSSGSLLWSKIIELPANINRQFGYSIIETSDKGFAFTGFSEDAIWLVKTDSSGNFIMSINTPADNSSTLLVYPNPFSIETTIHFEDMKNVQLLLYNINGQCVKRINELKSNTISLKRDNLQNGIYFIHLIQNNNIVAIKKIIITD